MKSFFKSLLVAAVFGLTLTASAGGDSYLYWMLEEGWDQYVAFQGKTLDYVQIRVEDGSGAKQGYLVNAYNTSSEKFYNATVGQFALIGSDLLKDSYRFIAELYCTDKSSGYTDYLTLADFQRDRSYGSSIYDITGQSTFTVPEPTSGMLALLGFGLLALRRKQKLA